MWRTIHTLAAGLPETPSRQQRASMMSFLHALPELLPCAKCGAHMRAMVHEGDGGLVPLRSADAPQFQTRRALFDYTVDMHNVVNRRLGRPTRDASRVYEEYRPRPTATGGASRAELFVALLVLALCLWATYRAVSYVRPEYGRTFGRGTGAERARPLQRRGGAAASRWPARLGSFQFATGGLSQRFN